ncbi:hypothetical protein [Pontibacillus sp. HMF3514]|uniref:hypothetical protein n=1 Tax=Pontibacillus sp. HMF3514 TaxID=2692425 RepID=UPI00131F858F|nr:hypothetical protein [Pontibacillus sp. HMF3514]QHE51229.1 hypothetical protein GS400_03925 [Pontibacillus sp. HMF3514]
MFEDWSSWSLGRVLSIILAIGFIMIWLQVSVWHHRGKFHKWQMWIPVVALPFFTLSSLFIAFYSLTWAGWIHTFLMIIGIVAGCYGGALHLIGISKRTGGFKYENFQSGPPFVLPFTIAAFCFIQLFNLWY